MVYLSARIRKVTPSVTLEITSLAKKMVGEGHNVVNFAAGEPDFDTPEYIKQAGIAAIQEGFTKYTPASGWLNLKNAVCEKLAKDNNLHYTPTQIIISCGAKHALYNILQVLCDETSEVIIGSPYWVSYPEMVKLAGGRIRFIQTRAENNFKIDKQSLKKSITRKTKVLIVNNPANPTGSVYSRQELKDLAEIAVENGIFIISDEIYEKLIFDNKQHVSIASLGAAAFKQTAVINGVSKSYAMTGWRIGYLACADEQIVKAINTLQSHSTSNPCSISQKAAHQALVKENAKEIRKMGQQFQSRRDCLLLGLAKIKQLSSLKPEGAFYAFVNIEKVGLDSVSLARRLLTETKVAVIPGAAFGRDDYIRISFATSLKQIEEGVRRIADWVDKIK